MIGEQAMLWANDVLHLKFILQFDLHRREDYVNGEGAYPMEVVEPTNWYRGEHMPVMRWYYELVQR
jgi:hypothetical protein